MSTFPPLTIKLPSGLELTLWPKLPQRSWGGFGPIISPGETEAECWQRMATILQTTDFDSVVRTFASERSGSPVATASPVAKVRARKKAPVQSTLPLTQEQAAPIPSFLLAKK